MAQYMFYLCLLADSQVNLNVFGIIILSYIETEAVLDFSLQPENE